MIKIDNYRSSNYCKVYFDVEPNRPSLIPERKIGIALAKKLPDYFIDGNEIYKIETSVPCSMTIAELKEMQENAQDRFSQEIKTLRERLDELNFLQGLQIKKDVKNE